ncbi:MAG: O-antigen ligase family protein [Pyrinomonadaceae bacterium]
MRMRARPYNHDLRGAPNRPATVLCLLAGACLLGSTVAVLGAGSSVNAMAFGAVSIAGMAAAMLLALDVPAIALVRAAFVASFFFKGDMMLFKINEVEDPSGLNVSLTLIAGLALLAHDLFIEHDDERVLPRYVFFLLAGLVILAAASVLVLQPTALGAFSLASLLTSVLIAYVIASHFATRDRIVQLVTLIAAGLLFTGVVALAQYTVEWPMNMSVLGTGTEEEQVGTQSQLLARVPAFLRTPNGMAWVVSSLLPLVLAPVICRARAFTSMQRSLLFAAALAGVMGVTLSLARGSWIGVIVAVTLLIVFGWAGLSAAERRGHFVSAAGALILTGLLLMPFADRIYDRLTADDEGSAAVRMPLMETALRMIDDNALVGVGLNGYRSNMTRYDETSMFVSQVFPQPVHNVFAHVTVEVGIPGGIIFCLLIIAALIESLRSMSRGDRLMFALGLGVAISLAAFVISGIKEPASLGSARPPMRTLFLLLGIAFALSRIRRRETPSEVPA